MKKVLLIIATLIATVGSSQKIYQLDNIHTTKRAGQVALTPEVYLVESKRLEFKKTQVVEVETQEFTKLNSKLNELKAIDSINSQTNYIKTSLMSSIEEYEEMGNVKYLKLAQLFANELDIDVFLYADEQINNHLKTKFKLLTLDKMDMRVHLLVIKNELKQSVEVKINKHLTQEIANITTQLQSVKKYRDSIIEPKIILQRRNVVTTKANVSKLEGDYISKGKCVMIIRDYKGLRRGEVVSLEKAIMYGAIKNNASTKKGSDLFENVNTNQLFMSQVGFLEWYAFQVEGKFNKG